MKIAFLLYPTKHVLPSEDTSFWIMRELSRRGHQVGHFLSQDMFFDGSTVKTRLSVSRLDTRLGFVSTRRDSTATNLLEMDCIFIRKEPPFDNEYLYTLQLLETLKHKVFILNDPTGIAMANEKLFILQFKKWIPETLVTSQIKEAEKFIRAAKNPVVIKMMDNKGGHGIIATHANDENLPSLLDMMTRDSTRTVMIQSFISARKYGDKRILLLDGKPLGAFSRWPSKKDFRANIGVGASFKKDKITASEMRLVEELAPTLTKNGLYFVGIDVIGEKLTEVNVTSPAGISDIITLENKHPEIQVCDFIEAKIKR